MDINLTLFAQAFVFASFIWFTAKFVWPPLMKMVAERQATIADGLAAAERGAKSLADAAARPSAMVFCRVSIACCIIGQMNLIVM